MTNDAALFYNVGKWSEYGLAVPNCGTKVDTQNSVILDFVNTCGRILSRMMWDVDARMRKPPSVNTLTRVHQLCMRSRTLLASAAVPAGRPFLESDHAVPAPEVFRVYPVPFFEVQNSWMKNWCQLTLISLTEAMQHTDNARPLEISEAFAFKIGQYHQRIYRMMATDLLQVPIADAIKPEFTLTNEQLRAYNPDAWYTPSEPIDTVPDLSKWPTENDLVPLTNGIPVTMLPNLGRYPANPANSSASTPGNNSPNPTGAVWIMPGGQV